MDPEELSIAKRKITGRVAKSGGVMGSVSGGQTALEGRGRRARCRYKGLESRAGLGCEQVPAAWEGGKDTGSH